MTIASALEEQIQPVTDWLSEKNVTKELATELETVFPASGDWCASILRLCQQGLDNGEVGSREAPGIRYGRVLKPNPRISDFSLDIVLMENLKGPHHSHPNGEIDLIFPCNPEARFDNHGKGWLTYEPGSAHYPTVTGGKAIVLYLLPGGEIEFTKR